MKIIFLILSLFLIGCETKTNADLRTTTPAYLGLRYVRDPATNLCFVVSHVSTNLIGDDIYSHVPCTEAVEQQIKR